MGAPRSHQRTWVKKDGAKPHQSSVFSFLRSLILAPINFLFSESRGGDLNATNLETNSGKHAGEPALKEVERGPAVSSFETIQPAWNHRFKALRRIFVRKSKGYLE
jgi:hypothetical protein